MRRTATRSGGRQARAAAAAALLACVAGLVVGRAAPAHAAVIRGFSQRFSTNDNGEITLVGNTLMTCPASAAACAGAQDGSGATLNNNNFTMTWVDVDADGATFDSSRATWTLPSGGSVLWAGLYWSADTSAGGSGAAAPTASARDTVLLAPPGGSYQTVTATQLDASGTRYQGFADVTATVRAGGSGSWTVANVQAGTGTDRYAGWALVVVEHNPAAAPRNLTVFDGFAIVSAGDTVPVPVSGFTTPPRGSFTTSMGTVTYEGDAGLTGDMLKLNGTTLSDALNPATNFFNSTVSAAGTRLDAKDPDYSNQLGLDIDQVDASGVLANNATSATMAFSSTSETYYPGVLTFTDDIFAPKLDLTKRGSDVNGGSLHPGDVLEYTVDLTNSGTDQADQVVVTDVLPAGVSLVPGSIRVDGAARTDAAGDDQAEYDGASRTLTARIGGGADATSGGTVAVADSGSLVFQVGVAADAAEGSTVSNSASASYSGDASGIAFASSTSTVSPAVAGTADLAVTGVGTPATVQLGHTATLTFTVSNAGPDTEPAAVLHDTLPAGLGSAAASPTQGSCSLSGGTLTCALGALGPGDSAVVHITGTADAAGTIDDTASVGGDRSDPDTGNNQASVSIPVNRAPVAADDSAAAAAATDVDVDVLGNDSDPDGDSLTVAAVTTPAHGSARIDLGGELVRYTPDAGFRGSDSFDYTVDDGRGGTASATVTVTVANAPPVAADDSATTHTGTSVQVDVVGNDSDANGDSLTVTAVTTPAHGSAEVGAGGTVGYTPDPGFRGSDSFEYTVSDGHGGSASATVTVTVANAAPVAADDRAAAGPDETVDVDVLGNDSDPDDDTLTVAAVTTPAHGNATIRPAGRVRYTPTRGFAGDDSFEYTVSDGHGDSAGATVTVTVANAAPVLPPVAANTAQQVPPGGVPAPLVGHDANGDPLIYTVVGGRLPPGVTLDRAGRFAGGATVPGRYTVIVRACDDRTPPACTITTLRLVVPATTPQGAPLPFTGVDTAAWSAAAAALLLGGVLALAALGRARRRHR